MTSLKQKAVDMESLLQGLFLVVTLWILLGSNFLDAEASKLFPRMSAGIVTALFVLFFVWRFIPESVLERLPEKEALTYGEEDAESEAFDERAVAVVFGLFGAYLLGVYLFGFLIATPLYVYGNLEYYGYGDRRRKVTITAATLLVVSVAYEMFRISLDQGLIFDIISW
jgi:hypothetical protein